MEMILNSWIPDETNSDLPVVPKGVVLVPNEVPDVPKNERQTT